MMEEDINQKKFLIYRFLTIYLVIHKMKMYKNVI